MAPSPSIPSVYRDPAHSPPAAVDRPWPLPFTGQPADDERPLRHSSRTFLLESLDLRVLDQFARWTNAPHRLSMTSDFELHRVFDLVSDC